MSGTGAPGRALLSGLLEEARALGFLGPGPVSEHLAHARGFVAATDGGPPARVADLGTGGGTPGLVLALEWLAADVVLIESQARRAEFLRRAVTLLRLDGRVTVLEQRAEVVGRTGGYRGAFPLVTARSFGPPGTTAECGAPLLVAGGRLLVSEPPSADPTRWPPDGLASLGLCDDGVRTTPYRFRVLTAASPCPARFPRRVGVPAKRPLF